MTNVGITGTRPDLIDRIMVGVILEKRDSRHAWQDHSWRAVGIIPGGGQDGAGRLLSEGPGWASSTPERWSCASSRKKPTAIAKTS